MNKDKTSAEKLEEKYIPTTAEREVVPGIVFRPIRSWHSLSYAGEGLEYMPGTKDRSGCLKKEETYGLNICTRPLTVTHRLYWNKKNSDKTISAFLSYPDGMGSADEYFWETLGTRKDGDIERFFGKNSERKMEKKIIKVLDTLKP